MVSWNPFAGYEDLERRRIIDRARIAAGIGAVEAESPSRNPFERFVDIGRDVARRVSDPFISSNPDDFRLLPLAHEEDLSDDPSIKDLALSPFASFLPPSFETGAPRPLQPAARAVRGLVSPGGIILSPLGGARASAASFAGSVAGGTAGSTFGPTGEMIGSLAGGVLPGARLAPRAAGILPGVPEEIVGGQAARTPKSVQEAIRAKELEDLAAQAPSQGTLGSPGQAIPGVDMPAPRTPRTIDVARRDAVIRDIEEGAPSPFAAYEPGSMPEEAFGRVPPGDFQDYVGDEYGAILPRRVSPPPTGSFDEFYGPQTGRADITPLGDIEGTLPGPGPILRSSLEEIYGPYAGTPPLGARPPARPPKPTFYDINAGSQQEFAPPYSGEGAPPRAAGQPPVPPTPAITAAAGAQPPTPPPVAPAASQLPSETARSLKQAAAMVAQDRPGAISKVVDYAPGVRKFRDWERPGRQLPENVLGAQVAENSAREELAQEFFSTRMPLLERMEQAFGEDASRGAKTNVRFLGSAKEAANDITGTVVDIADNPELYDLNPAQKQFLADFDARNTDYLRRVNKGYGTEIGEFAPKPGGAFLPHLEADDASLEALEAYYGSAARAAVAASGRSKERIFQTARERMAADPSFKPNTDVSDLLRRMDAHKSGAASGVVFRAGVGGLDAQPVGSATAHTYKPVNLGGGVIRWFPAKEAKQIEELRQPAAQSGFVRLLADLQATVLGGDLSPLTIQFGQKVLFHPGATATQLIRGKAAWSPDKLAGLVRDDPQGWKDFAFATGRSISEPVPGEFGVGFLSKIPKAGEKISDLNTRLYNFVLSAAKNDFVDDVRQLERSGLSHEDAIAVAGDFSQRMIPAMNTTRYGLSRAQGQARRAPFTSISFIRKSGELLMDATRGYAKIAAGGGKVLKLTPKEDLAVRRVTKAAAFVGTVSVASAVLEAERTGQDPLDAAWDALTPTSPRFLSIVIMGKRLPLGGPLRALFKASYPQRVKGSPVPIPFGGIVPYAEYRVTPALGTAYHVARNRDVQQRPIYKAKDSTVVKALRIGEYAIERFSPVTPATVIRDVRTGELGPETAGAVTGQFFGQNLAPARTVGDLRREWEKDFAPYEKLPTNPREAKDKKVLTRSEYRKRNPEVDAKLFLANKLESLETIKARTIALDLMRELRISMEDVKAFEVQKYESDERRLLRRYFERQLGQKAMRGSENAAPARIPVGATR